MKPQNIALLLILGTAIWIVGTIYYALAGVQTLETTGKRYWINFIASPIISALACMAILRWQHIRSEDWTSAMVLLAIPGMIGESVVLTHLTTFMPRLQTTSGGRYGAFLFFTYAIVLAVAEAVTLKARG
jgi:hypothetical protein